MLMLESEQDEGVQRKSLFNCTGSVYAWVELYFFNSPLQFLCVVTRLRYSTTTGISATTKQPRQLASTITLFRPF